MKLLPLITTIAIFNAHLAFSTEIFDEEHILGSASCIHLTTDNPVTLLVKLEELHTAWEQSEQQNEKWNQENCVALENRRKEIYNVLLPALELKLEEKKCEEFSVIFGKTPPYKIIEERLNLWTLWWQNKSSQLKELHKKITDLKEELFMMEPGFLPYLMYKTEQKYWDLMFEKSPRLKFYRDFDFLGYFVFAYHSLHYGKDIQGGTPLLNKKTIHFCSLYPYTSHNERAYFLK